MNYLFGYVADIRCYEEYVGSGFFNIFLGNYGFLVFITLISIFLYFFFNKYKNKKIMVRFFKTLLWCLLFYIGYILFDLIFGNILGISNLVSDSGFTYECWSQGLYFIVFGIFYLVFSMLLYINIRIWSSFIDKKNKYTKWLNIIYIVIMIILFIIFILSKGQINVLAID